LVEASWPEALLLQAKQEEDSLWDKAPGLVFIHHYCFPPLPALNLSCDMKDLTGPLRIFCLLVE
jgi:hypothetical protein